MRWLAVCSLAACTSGATVRLELANHTPSFGPAGVLADGTSLRLKIVAAYLAEDVDPVSQNNAGQTSMVWLNPQCADDISDCNVSGFANPAGGPRVTDFFDLARPTAEVNAELNSQDTPVAAGTYRHARVEMCKAVGGETLPSEPTLMWAGPGMDSEQPFTSGDCGRTSLPFDPPLELAAGDAVRVELGYDLANAVVTGAPASSPCSLAGDPRCFRACVDTGPTTRACMDFPDFAPSAELVVSP
jgi:hypothetical protein